MVAVVCNCGKFNLSPLNMCLKVYGCQTIMKKCISHCLNLKMQSKVKYVYLAG